MTLVMMTWCFCPVPHQQSAERCVSTLLDLIQTKVNYVVQEAIVVIRDIFRKYPNKYEGFLHVMYHVSFGFDQQSH